VTWEEGRAGLGGDTPRGTERGRTEAEATEVKIEQRALPLPWQLIRDVEDTDFAHPAELHFSRLLTFYRIRWAYEPTSFPLAFSSDGRPSEMFTPDFYLPDHRLYIELTTMRQRLVTRKNRKIRRLRELYPNVRVKLLYRRDYDRLRQEYPFGELDRGAALMGDVLIDEESLQRRIAEMADALAQDLSRKTCQFDREPEPIVPALFDSECLGIEPDDLQPECEKQASTPTRPLLIAVDPGSARFMEALTAGLAERGVAFDTDRISLSRFTATDGQRRVRVRRGPRSPIVGRPVILVADIVSTGLSLAYLTRWLRRRGATDIELCVLLDRKEARLVDVPLTHVGFEVPNHLLVGFGLRLRRQFAKLPFIARLVVAPPEVAPE